LALFKYFNFASDSVIALFNALGFELKPMHLRLVLPFGISFFTFETMSYTIDVYRREVKPAERYLDYLLFVCFFPHLVAGPIVRASELLPQLEQPRDPRRVDYSRAFFLIVSGLFLKVVIANHLATHIVDDVFAAPNRHSSLEVLVAIYAYAFQIYADFSGYTDVALGSAALFGYELPENFDRPYCAQDLQDFWRRWHITLSSWLRDYLYIPLGGSRGTSLRTYRNLMITMLLGGLWHGASWNFVIWGALHGVALAGTRMWQRARSTAARPGLPFGISVVLTFHYVCFAWIFFRAQTFGHALVMLERITHVTFGATNISREVLIALGVAALFHFMPKRVGDEARELFVRCPAWLQGIALAATAYGLHWAAGAKAEPFVYGQF
jgi:D-alanyl-lipoteichoic acid acyltransferase DltB (MBOAT superfamily)